MRTYLGSKLHAFAAIILPCYIGGTMIVASVLLMYTSDIEVLYISSLCIYASVTGLVYYKHIHLQLYSWGEWCDKSVRIKPIFSRSYELEYKTCSIGIGFYIHGILNSSSGTAIYYIYVSTQPFDERYRSRINLWKPSYCQIKVPFRKDLYDYLLQVLPKTQARSLQSDYVQYIVLDLK